MRIYIRTVAPRFSKNVSRKTHCSRTRRNGTQRNKRRPRARPKASVRKKNIRRRGKQCHLPHHMDADPADVQSKAKKPPLHIEEPSPPLPPLPSSLFWVSPVSKGSHREQDTQRARHQSVTSKTDPFEVRIVDRCFPRESKPISHEY